MKPCPSRRGDVWIVDLTGAGSRQLTFDPSVSENHPLWTPDGSQVAFGPLPSWKAADGTGEVTPLAEGGRQLRPNAFRNDGKLLIVEDFHYGLRSVSLDDLRTATHLWDSSAWARNADLSPDGRWLAYESDEAGPGQWEVWIRSFPDVDSTTLKVSSGGGSWALWNPNPQSGQELFYVGPDGMMSVRIGTEPGFRYSPPEKLFDTAGLGTSTTVGTNRRIDVASDGSRFLMFRIDAAFIAPRQPVLVQNWAAELERLVPVP